MPTTTVNTYITPEADSLKSYNESARKRLMANVTVNEAPHPRLGTPCWIHGGAPSNKDGHRYFWYYSKHSTAHRSSFRIYKGEIPEGQLVRHKCGDPACVNPNHLELGTAQQNMSDMVMMSNAPVKAQSGIRGVYKTINGKWQGAVTCMNNTFTKVFKLKEDAAAWRKRMARELHGALVGYSASSTLSSASS